MSVTIAGRPWEGWRVRNASSSDGTPHSQRVHILAWSERPIVRAIDEPEVPLGNDAIPTDRPSMVRLSQLFRTAK